MQSSCIVNQEIFWHQTQCDLDHLERERQVVHTKLLMVGFARRKSILDGNMATTIKYRPV